MAFDGNGTFLRDMNWTNDKLANIKIRADRHDIEDNNLAAGITACITRDGQSAILANLPMSGYRHTNVANAINRNEYAAFGQIQDGSIASGTIGGTSTAYTMALTVNPSSYISGQVFWGKINVTNTGAATLNVGILGAKSIKSFGTTDVVAGELVIGKIYAFQYDGTNFVIVSGSQFLDSGFQILGSADATKKATFEVDGITTATTRTLTVQDVSGTIYVTGGTDVAIADGGTGASTAAAGFDNLKQVATTTATGVVELATAAELGAFTANVVPTGDIMPVAKISTTVIPNASATSGTIPIPVGMSRYEVHYTNFVPSAGGGVPTMEVSVDGGSTWVNAYYTQLQLTATTASQTSTDSSTSIPLSNNALTGGVQFPCYGKIDIGGFIASAPQGILINGGCRIAGLNATVFGSAMAQTALQINAVRFRFTTSNIASGTITVWAWK